MTARVIWAAAALLSAVTVSASADQLLWDNNPGGVGGLQNPNYALSSERNTGIWDSTWVVDDIDIAQIPGVQPEDITLTRLSWIGARDANFGYSTVDVIILDGAFNTIFEASGLSYEYVNHPYDLDSGFQLYEGMVSLVDQNPPAFGPIALPEHFYIGVRLVGDGYFQGANRAVTSSIDAVRGRTEGYTLAPLFGAPNWKPASEVWYAPPTDSAFEFAFRLYGDVIPEPAGLAVLLGGGVLLLRKRTR